ncbi:glycosyltransferase [Stenotrophomonas mori]|uniref:Glycosyltransferase n=1 Tax=Stenotrophomonas mori TaxID=2871096 RepID=A0ABT0SHZ5_9GAMM|nr:glycosyltransferase [Stenotrophomonas mori]MCL7714933.1 glycosyltransferase [Stenotrophomonas mori]
MRILLVAYEFPPSRSPRALRWGYLVRELVLLGHDVHVLLPDLGQPGIEFPAGPGRVVLHTTFAGPCGWLVGRSRRRRARQGIAVPSQSAPTQGGAPSGIELNWRGHAVERLKQVAGWFLFPDVRAEWTPWARAGLRRLLAEVKPDVVVTSHEPASTLPLGLQARRLGAAWVADLGDPVDAVYTPARWKARARALEKRVSAEADAVIVTTEATRELLVARHGQDRARCPILANGYDDRIVLPAHAGELDRVPGRLELLYAGRLYGYRDPTPLLQAVAATPGVRLTLVVPDPPTGGEAAIAAAAAGRVRILGSLPHAQVQAMQRDADVLVNIGNRGLPAQIPAKLYEYLGFERPILHLDTGAGDAAADWLRGFNRGWLCAAETEPLSVLLAGLVERKRQGLLGQGLELAPVAEYAHSARGRRLAIVLQEVVSRQGLARHGMAARAADAG